MNYYEVAPNQIVRAGADTFTYSSQTPLLVGQIVSVEVGHKAMVGIVMAQVDKPAYSTKPITKIIETIPLPLPLIELSWWLVTYYATPLATVLQTLLPRGLQTKRRPQPDQLKAAVRKRTNIVFTLEQRQAIQTVQAMSPGSALLHGITGSGKTAVYLELTKQIITAGKSVIILVPEIALTSQLVDEFSATFPTVILAHSRQTEAIRHMTWRKVLASNEPLVIIGPRSALFLPSNKLGLIVIDECHEPSFKQEQAPRYSALRAASVLATHHGAKLLLGSATPSVNDYYLAQQSGRPIITMNTLARSDAVKPHTQVIDMTKKAHFLKHRFLSTELLRELDKTFASGHQALIFHNRRGSAASTLCENCGWSAICPRCFVPFTLHTDAHQLRCHICGTTERVPTSCPVCSSTNILFKGIGTKLIESELTKLFPNKIIARFDGDNTIDTVDTRYAELYNGEIDLIVGTQVIAKGLDLPKLRTVGVIQADAGLALPDYTSSERTFQLLAQVVGRVGRSAHSTNVIVQSYQPTHPAVQAGLTQDYARFYADTLAERKKSIFPPFCFLLKLTCIYKTEAAAIKNAQQLAAELRRHIAANVQILGPTPAFYERTRDTYRWQLIVKAKQRAQLVALLPLVPSTHWQTELDPISLL